MRGTGTNDASMDSRHQAEDVISRVSWVSDLPLTPSDASLTSSTRFPAAPSPSRFASLTRRYASDRRRQANRQNQKAFKQNATRSRNGSSNGNAADYGSSPPSSAISQRSSSFSSDGYAQAALNEVAMAYHIPQLALDHRQLLVQQRSFDCNHTWVHHAHGH